MGIVKFPPSSSMRSVSFASKKVLSSLAKQLRNLNLLDKEMIMAGWNTKQIRDIIQEETRIEYSLRHIRRLAHKIGFSLITPRVRHMKKDKEKIRKFREEFKKNLKESIKAIPS